MKDREHWERRYRDGDLPWDTGRHDRHLEDIVRERCIAPCRVLELGCGSGSNAVWLAARGFEVTGIDISPLAISSAETRASRLGMTVRFAAADILKERIPGGPYGFVFDRGCFHSMEVPGNRAQYARLVHEHLTDGGLWFSLIGSSDAPEREVGPPRLSVLEVATAVESVFEILELKAAHFDSGSSDPVPAWACLMRKRAV